MLTSRSVIVLIGALCLRQNALEIIRGFKAVTIVHSLNEDIIQNVHRHNKNVVYATSSYSLALMKFTPIIVNLSSSTDMDKMTLGQHHILEDFPRLMESKGVDVGDHVSQDSTSSEAVNHDCLLCKIANRTNEKPEHILYENDNFYVVPGLGAFFDGYVMIVPKAHVMSVAELSEEQFKEFLRVLSDWRFILESVYNKKIFVFECGSGKGGGGKHATSIVHSHVHMAPTDMPVLSYVQKSGLHPALIEPSDLLSYGEHPYMLYIDQDDNWFITSDPKTYFPRQHPRQILADYMGLAPGEYNWRLHPLREKMDVIAEEIVSFLKENFESLPAWIQESTSAFL